MANGKRGSVGGEVWTPKVASASFETAGAKYVLEALTVP